MTLTTELLQTTALKTTLNLEDILFKLRRNNSINLQNSSERDRIVYIFHCFDVDESGDTKDYGYQVLSPLIVEDEMMLYPYPLEEDFFSNINMDNDPDNTKHLEIIIDFLKSKGITSIFTGLLPDNQYFMGETRTFENEEKATTTYLEPLNNEETRKYMSKSGLILYHCGNLPDTSFSRYLN